MSSNPLPPPLGTAMWKTTPTGRGITVVICQGSIANHCAVDGSNASAKVGILNVSRAFEGHCTTTVDFDLFGDRGGASFKDDLSNVSKPEPNTAVCVESKAPQYSPTLRVKVVALAPAPPYPGNPTAMSQSDWDTWRTPLEDGYRTGLEALVELGVTDAGIQLNPFPDDTCQPESQRILGYGFDAIKQWAILAGEKSICRLTLYSINDTDMLLGMLHSNPFVFGDDVVVINRKIEQNLIVQRRTEYQPAEGAT